MPRSEYEQPKKETTEAEKKIASTAYNLLESWNVVPGTQPDGSFSQAEWKAWYEKVKQNTTESGHLKYASYTIGKVLIHSPSDSDGLWIDKSIAKELNDITAEHMRRGFSIALYNSRGAHLVDPNGQAEQEIAAICRQKAEAVENATFHRLANTLKELAEDYEKEAIKGRICSS